MGRGKMYKMNLANLLQIYLPQVYLLQTCLFFKIPQSATACTASVIFSTGRVNAKRTCPRPRLPKLLPGVQRTPDFSRSSITNATSSVKPSGISPQANIVPWLSGMFQPILRKPPQSASLLLWYSLQRSKMPSSGPSKAAIAPYCTGRNAP